MQRRFDADPAFRATDLLLQERVPRAPVIYPHPAEVSSASERSQRRPSRTFASSPRANTPVPEVHLLSNGSYHVAVTNAGGGYSRWRDLAVTRWHEDPTRDCWGSFCYLRDVTSGAFWSVAHQPIAAAGDELRSHLFAGPRRVPPPRRRHRHPRGDRVSPEDDIELRRVTSTTAGEPRARSS